MRFTESPVKSGVLAVFLTVLMIFCQSAIAQENSQKDAPKVSEKEANLAKKLQEGTDVAAKMKLAEKFVKEFPNSPIREQVARYIAGQMSNVKDAAQKTALMDNYAKIFAKTGETDFIAPYRIEALARANRYDEAVQLGSDYFTRVKDDLDTRLFLTIEGTNQVRAGNTKYAAQTKDFAVKAVEIIESGQKPAELDDENWKKAQTDWIAQFYQSLGFLESAANGKQAFTYFEKAVKVNPKDVNSWAMMGFITNQNYQDLAKKYVIAEGAEQEKLRKEAEVELDKVIDFYARVVAMTDGDAAQANLNTQIRGDLESYYKYRHKNSTDGLQALIDKYKTAK